MEYLKIISEENSVYNPMAYATYRVPLTKQHVLQARKPHTAQTLVRYVVIIFTAASSAATRYSGGYCPTSRANSRLASSHLSAAA